MDFNNFFNLIPTLLQGFQGYSTMSRGYETQIQAAQMSAQGYRQAASATEAIANYNIELDRQQLARQLDTLSRSISSTTSTQLAQAASTGFAVGSKSYLAVINNSLSNASRQAMQMKDAQVLTAQQRRFEAQSAQVDYENRARAAEYQGELARWQQGNAQGEALQSIFSGILGAFGG